MKTKAAAFAFCSACAFGGAQPARPASTVAVLAVSEKEANEVTALENDLEMLGVPYETTQSVTAAVRAPVIVLAGTVTNVTFPPADRERLYRYTESGGVLVATHIQGDQYFPLFGVTAFSTSRENHGIHFMDSALDPALRYINRPEERDITLGDPMRYREFN